MNKKITIIAMIIIAFTSCKKEAGPAVTVPSTPVKTDTEKTITINLLADGKPIAFGQYSYFNLSKTNYSLSVLKMILSKPTVLFTDGTTDSLATKHLYIDSKDTSLTSIKIKIPVGKTFKGLNFGFGVNPENNHSGAQEGALDPSTGMFWTWNTGYIFFKHEGFFYAKDGSKKYLIYHYGSDQAYVKLNVISPEVVENGSNAQIKLFFDLNGVYGSTIDFNNNYNHQSTSSSDDGWIDAIKFNIGNAFFLKVSK